MVIREMAVARTWSPIVIRGRSLYSCPLIAARGRPSPPTRPPSPPVAARRRFWWAVAALGGPSAAFA
jgi:hypothetical protein